MPVGISDVFLNSLFEPHCAMARPQRRGHGDVGRFDIVGLRGRGHGDMCRFDIVGLRGRAMALTFTHKSNKQIIYWHHKLLIYRMGKFK